MNLAAVPTHLLYRAIASVHALGGYYAVQRADDPVEPIVDELANLIIEAFEGRLDDAVATAMEYLLTHGDEPMTEEILAKAWEKSGVQMGDELANFLEDPVTDMLERAYMAGRTNVLDPLGIPFVNQAVDDRATEALANDTLYWIGDYWDGTLGQQIADTINANVIQKGLSRADAGAALQDLLGNQFPDRTRSYWNLVAAAGVQRGAVFGAVNSFRQAKVKSVRLLNPQDMRTSDLCDHLAGMVFPAKYVYDTVDDFTAAKNPDEAREAHPWYSSAEIKAVLGMDDPDAIAASFNIVPPLHGNCRSILVPVDFEPQEAADALDDTSIGGEAGNAADEVDGGDDEQRSAPARVTRAKDAKEVSLVLAFNPAGELLFGLRDDNAKWTVPGGHAYVGESPGDCAVRELYEESGLRARTLAYLYAFANPDGTIIHVYAADVDGTPTGENDPDHECTVWEFVPVRDGLPEEVALHLHGPKDPADNFILKLFEVRFDINDPPPSHDGSKSPSIDTSPLPPEPPPAPSSTPSRRAIATTTEGDQEKADAEPAATPARGEPIRVQDPGEAPVNHDGPTSLPTARKEFAEDDHPRGPGGKFAPKGTGPAVSDQTQPKEVTPGVHPAAAALRQALGIKDADIERAAGLIEKWREPMPVEELEKRRKVMLDRFQENLDEATAKLADAKAHPDPRLPGRIPNIQTDVDHWSKAIEDFKKKPLEFFQPRVEDLVKEHFEAMGLGQEHEQVSFGWKRSSSNPNAMRLHGALVAAGVPGSIPEKDMEYKTRDFESGKDDLGLRDYVREMYLLSQGALRADGVKEIELYRGVDKQLDGLHDGQEVRIETRPASSWADESRTATFFAGKNEEGAWDRDASPGSGVIKAKVPAELVYSNYRLFGNASGEDEYVVLGAEKLPVVVDGEPKPRAADLSAKRSAIVVIDLSSTADEDWLRSNPDKAHVVPPSQRETRDFQEEEHPREPDGKFAPAGGGGAPAPTAPPPSAPPSAPPPSAAAEENQHAGEKIAAKLRRALGITAEDEKRADRAWAKINAANAPERLAARKQANIDRIAATLASMKEKSPGFVDIWEKKLEAAKAAPLESFRQSVKNGVEDHFEDLGLSNLHIQQSKGWVNSSSDPDVMKLHGVLAALGVPGKMPADEKTGGAYEFFKEHPPDQYKKYVKEMYLISQAALRGEGVKELELYRGVTHQASKAQAGQEVKLATRPISSWTDKTSVAENFRKMTGGEGKPGLVVKAKVPAAAVYSHWRLFGNSSGENEFVVLGASNFASVVTKDESAAEKRSAAEPLVIDASSTTDEDWLRTLARRKRHVVPASEQETRAFAEEQHPRGPGGKFAPKGSAPAPAAKVVDQTKPKDATPSRGPANRLELTAEENAAADRALTGIENYKPSKTARIERESNTSIVDITSGKVQEAVRTDWDPELIYQVASKAAKYAAVYAKPREREDHAAVAQAAYELYRAAGGEESSPLAMVGTAAHFDKLGLGDIHREQWIGWNQSSASKEALRLNGALEALGVHGTYDTHGQVDSSFALTGKRAANALESGRHDEDLQRYVHENYALTQARLRQEGVKDVTLYRGVVNQPGEIGEEIKLPTRAASSWASTQETADVFTDLGSPATGRSMVVSARVPASHIYMMPGGLEHDEFVVLGASDLPARVETVHRAGSEQRGDFQEEQHPRGPDGKFVAGAGAGAEAHDQTQPKDATPPRGLIALSPEEEQKADAAWQKIVAYSPKATAKVRQVADEHYVSGKGVLVSAGSQDGYTALLSDPVKNAENLFEYAASYARNAVEKPEVRDEEAAIAREFYRMHREAGGTKEDPLRAVAVAEHFESLGLDRVHREQTSGWVESSSSPPAMKLHAQLVEMGVHGSGLKNTDDAPWAEESLAEGKHDEKLRAYVRQMYALSQAELRADGVNEVRIYRGVQKQGDFKSGDDVKIATRPASSWTDRIETAESFARPSYPAGAVGNVIEITVPRERIYSSWHLFSNASGEREYVVLGAEDVTAHVDKRFRAGELRAALATLDISDTASEDWLRSMRTAPAPAPEQRSDFAAAWEARRALRSKRS